MAVRGKDIASVIKQQIEDFDGQVNVVDVGTVVEIGDRETIFSNPTHPYTKALMKAVPIADPKKRFRGDDINLSLIHI